MCQLLGMNCNVPTDICFSFEGFRARGGLTADHCDGWGIAFFEGRGCRLFIDAKSSVESPIAELVRHYPIRSMNVIAHIRKATQQNVALENTHPFRREMWGKYWIFAHNGDLGEYRHPLSGRFLPVGRTDSEHAFCQILEYLWHHFGPTPPDLHDLAAALAEIATTIAEHGTFNFLLSNGEALFARCSTQLSYIIRQAPFSKARLVDADLSVDFAQVTTPNDRVAVIATEPLTNNEQWTRFAPGQLILFRDGDAVRKITSSW